MTSTKASLSAHDALFDELERELAALTFAPLDELGLAAAPCLCVDEFANDFMNWSVPPQHYPAGWRGPHGRPRHSAR